MKGERKNLSFSKKIIDDILLTTSCSLFHIQPQNYFQSLFSLEKNPGGENRLRTNMPVTCKYSGRIKNLKTQGRRLIAKGGSSPRPSTFKLAMNNRLLEKRKSFDHQQQGSSKSFSTGSKTVLLIEYI